MPRVLHVVTKAQRRGAELAACALNDHLTGQGLPGEVVALSGGGPAGLPVPVLGATPRSPTTWATLHRRAADADVVVAHGSATLNACALALHGQCPPFVYVSIGDPRYWADSWSKRLRVAVALRRAAAVVALTASASAVLQDWYRLRPAALHVLPNFRDPHSFAPPDVLERRTARSHLGLDDDAIVGVLLGALTPEKRPLCAIEAATQVPDFRLVVAGDGPLRAEVRRLAEESGGRVIYLDTTPNPELLLHAADLVVVASESEGLPGVLIEAGLCAVPAAATRVGWISDLVVEGETGALADLEPHSLARAITRVVERRAALGQAARARCLQHHTIEAVVPRWATLLQSVASHRLDLAS